ncbi:hypothetical protein QDZ16_004809 [Pluralibacter gergoviae]|nr:hypothetical protein [Pluralibacter gergoviae]
MLILGATPGGELFIHDIEISEKTAAEKNFLITSFTGGINVAARTAEVSKPMHIQAESYPYRGYGLAVIGTYPQRAPDTSLSTA